MSLYHLVELAVVGGAVIVAVGAAYKRFVPRLGKAAKAGAAGGCSSCSSCGSCGPASGPASVEHPGQAEQPLVFQQPRR